MRFGIAGLLYDRVRYAIIKAPDRSDGVRGPTMKNHPYEYKVLVEYITPEDRGRHPHFTHMEDQEAFAGILNNVFANLPKSIPEGWEVNSHSISVSGDSLIVTVLLRRPRDK